MLEFEGGRLHDLRDKRNISATHWNKGTGGNAAEKTCRKCHRFSDNQVHNQFRESRTKLERDLQILRLIKTNLVVDVLGGYSLKGLSRLGKTASRRVLTNTQKTCCIYACFFVFVHFSAANALSIKAFWWHFSGKQFLFRENKNILR